MRSTRVYGAAFLEKIIHDFASIEVYPIIATNLQREPNVRTSNRRSLDIGPNSLAMVESTGPAYNQKRTLGSHTSSPGGSK